MTITIQSDRILASSITARSTNQYVRNTRGWRWWVTQSKEIVYTLRVYTTGGSHFFETLNRAERDGWVKQIDEILSGIS